MSNNLCLYVVMMDEWGATNAAMLSNHATPLLGYTRVVEVELTPKQCELIEPRRVGKNGRQDMYERVSPLCIQEKGDEDVR